MAETFSVVGKPLPRKHAKGIATGKLKFYSDVMLPGMLYMSILRSTYAHARIKSIDTSKAEALTGVRAVLTHKDVPETLLSYPDFIWVLQEKIFYHGCEVAAVAADTLEIAEEATRLIEVDYDPLEVLLDPEEAMKPGKPEIHDGTPNLIFGEPILIEWGDVEAAFAEADQVIEKTYYTHNVWNCALENHGNVVYWDLGQDDQLVIHTGTQSAFDNRDTWARALGIPYNNLRLIQYPMGGGFGGKSYHMRHHGIAALLSKKTGKPVKFIGGREDEFTRCNTRHAFKFHIKSGVKNDGTITATKVVNYQNAGAYFSDTIGVGYVAFGTMDFWPQANMHWEGYPVYTNCPTAGAFRGYGNLQTNYAWEQHLDQMAESIGMDPIEFRKKNHVRAGDPFGYGVVLGSEEWDACIDQGAQAIGWSAKWKGFGTPYQTSGSKRRAVGIATGAHVGAYGQDAAVVKLQLDGSAQVLSGVADAGQGPTTVVSQIAAEALKIPYDKVSTLLSDTAVVPWCSATVASRATVGAGNAVINACADVMEQLFQAAAAILGVDAADLDAENGEVFVKTAPDTKASYAEIMETVFPPVIIGVGRWMVASDYAIQGFGADYADIEVDVETGELTVLKIVGVRDAGRAINANTCANQVSGGIASQGIGMGVTEDFIPDLITGKILNANQIDYAIPTTMDAPEVEAIILDVAGDPEGPFGAKGCSEIAIVSAGPAIANAFYNATGVRVTEYPLSADKILKALGKV